MKLTAESNGVKLEERIFQIELALAYKMNDLHGIGKIVSTFTGIGHRIIKGKYIEGKTLEKNRRRYQI